MRFRKCSGSRVGLCWSAAGWIGGTYCEQPPTERSDILFLYGKMTELMQATHTIRQERREKGQQ
ncbi:MAG: hypothetical protein ABW019_10185 [Chitinophagaceae bacterium]